MNKTCGTCRYWRTIPASYPAGYCQRNAPRLYCEPGRGMFDSPCVQGQWPKVGTRDWCGEWKQYARPCPLCGDDDVRTDGSQLRATEDFDAAAPAPNKIWAASCFSCNLDPGAFGHSPKQAIEAWNKMMEERA